MAFPKKKIDWAVVLGAALLASNACALPTSIRKEVLSKGYDYSSSLSASEFAPGEVATLSNNAQKAGYNVSGKPIVVELHSSTGGSRLVASNITDPKGNVVVPFDVGQREGQFHLVVYFLNSRHLYAEHINILEFDVFSRTKCFVFLGLLGLMAVVLFGVARDPKNNPKVWALNPLFHFRSGGKPLSEQLQFLLATAATSMASIHLSATGTMLVFLLLLGLVLGLRWLPAVRGSRTLFDNVINSWVVLATSTSLLSMYGQAEFFADFLSQGVVLGPIIGLLLLLPAPLFWVPIGLATASLTPFNDAVWLSVLSCVLFGLYSVLQSHQGRIVGRPHRGKAT